MALVSLDKINARLGFTTGDDPARDEELQFILDSNTEMLESYCETFLEENVYG